MTSRLSTQKVVAGLMATKSTPNIHTDPSGIFCVDIAGEQWTLPEVREIAATPDVREQLEAAGVHLGWLATSDPTLDRADLTAEEVGLIVELEELGRRSWQVAQALYHRAMDLIDAQGLPRPDEPIDQSVERIHRVLIGVSRTLEGTLPRGLRQSETARLRIDWVDQKQGYANWVGNRDTRPIDIGYIVESRALEVSSLHESLGSVLPELFVNGLRSGDVALPAFRRSEESTEETVRLRWLEPVLSDLRSPSNV